MLRTGMITLVQQAVANHRMQPTPRAQFSVVALWVQGTA
jgi:hypothetical protein